MIAQQQSTETCAALNQLVVNQNTEDCTTNDICTSITCKGDFSYAIPVTTELRFSPCTLPFTVLKRSVSTFYHSPLIDRIVSTNESIPINPPSLGIENIQIQQLDTGIIFGVSDRKSKQVHDYNTIVTLIIQVTVTKNGVTTVVFPATEIPLQCDQGKQAEMAIVKEHCAILFSCELNLQHMIVMIYIMQIPPPPPLPLPLPL